MAHSSWFRSSGRISKSEAWILVFLSSIRQEVVCFCCEERTVTLHLNSGSEGFSKCVCVCVCVCVSGFYVLDKQCCLLEMLLTPCSARSCEGKAPKPWHGVNADTLAACKNGILHPSVFSIHSQLQSADIPFTRTRKISTR